MFAAPSLFKTSKISCSTLSENLSGAIKTCLALASLAGCAATLSSPLQIAKQFDGSSAGFSSGHVHQVQSFTLFKTQTKKPL
jgi:hypothetical protein